MDSYNFTFKDVLKRRERMINRVEKWEIHVLAIIMLVVTAFFTFSTLCFADEGEETLSYTVASGIVATEDKNYFIVRGNGCVGYIRVEPGYIYTFYNNTNWDDFYIYSCDNEPVLNGIYTILSNISSHSTYSIRVEDETYLYVGTSVNINPFSFDDNIPVTRVKIGSMDGSVNDLVDNVGINQIWDIFGTGVDFVYIVVIVAFGIFLVALAIRKISKGKSEM